MNKLKDVRCKFCPFELQFVTQYISSNIFTLIGGGGGGGGGWLGDSVI